MEYGSDYWNQRTISCDEPSCSICGDDTDVVNGLAWVALREYMQPEIQAVFGETLETALL